MPRCRRTRPTDRPVSPSTGTTFHSPVSHRGAADAGRHGGTESLERERGHEAHTVDFGLRTQCHTALLRLRVEVVAERGARRLEEELVLRELGKRDTVPVRQRMVSWAR